MFIRKGQRKLKTFLRGRDGDGSKKVTSSHCQVSFAFRIHRELIGTDKPATVRSQYPHTENVS